ncbi:MAG TPA: hypothetical protein VMM78_10315 [Thermomicrobiales bacterium]|nr:hypothetical protein [Thermomicrobiales bacterium]
MTLEMSLPRAGGEGSADRVARVAELGIEHVFFSITAPVDERMQAMGELRRSVR